MLVAANAILGRTGQPFCRPAACEKITFFRRLGVHSAALAAFLARSGWFPRPKQIKLPETQAFRRSGLAADIRHCFQWMQSRRDTFVFCGRSAGPIPLSNRAATLFEILATSPALTGMEPEHIGDHDLERYHLGMAEEPELTAIEEHLLGCPAERAEQSAVWVDCHSSCDHNETDLK